MMEPSIRITLPTGRRAFYPGETLWFEYRLEGASQLKIKAIEASVLWHTEGKGEEDMAVHFFRRVEPGPDGTFDARQPRTVSTVLPRSPLSYDGVLVKICWCVRVRAFPSRGKEIVEEQPFQLGDTPPARLAVV